MSYIIKPNEFNAPSGSRIVFHDKKKKYMYLKIPIEDSNEQVIVDNELINSNMERFIYKFQVWEDGWKDLTKYSLLLDRDSLGEFWTDEISLKDSQLNNLINYYLNIKDKDIYYHLRLTYKKVCEDLWLNHGSNHRNLEKYLNFIKKSDLEMNLLFQNLNLYLEYTYRLKKKFNELRIHRNYYDEIANLNEDSELYKFIKSEIKELEQSDLQFSYVLLGQYYSFTGDRKNASEKFRNLNRFDTDWENHFLVGQGSATYYDIDEKNINYNNVTFVGERTIIDAGTTVLVSVDIKYLRYYVVSLLYNSLALKKYHFHIHVIGENVEAIQAITKAQVIYNQILEFSQSKKAMNHPTFSYENTPEFASSTRTYSACARFVNADFFMEEFGTDLLILDGDMFIHNNLDNYINKMSKFHIGIAIAKGITPIMPWRRFMAGNLFIKNSIEGKHFMKSAKNYILELIHHKKSWTLDQNALSYAYENTIKKYPNTKMENIYKHKRPVIHPPIRQLIEKS